MRGLLAKEPTLFGVFVGAVLTCAVQFGLPIDQGQANAITAVVVAGIAWWLRASVVSPATAVAVAQNAATKAVEIVDQTTAGATGVVTAAGRTAVDTAVQTATGTVGGLVGSLTSPLLGMTGGKGYE